MEVSMGSVAKSKYRIPYATNWDAHVHNVIS